jgi:single-stranded-DNA-specific exonuclease
MNWIEPLNVLAPEVFKEKVGGHPILTRRISQLGIRNPDQAAAFLDPAYYRPGSPLDLSGLSEAVDRLEQVISKKEAVLVWGDFDVDGQTATTLMVSLLELFDVKVDYYIPIREKESHGIHLKQLRKLLENGYQVMITCDTGISAVTEVDEINQLGIDVLITDHHDLPDILPSARAIVNPHFLPESHPMSGLPGVGVVYQVAREVLRRTGKEEICQSFLDLVALGIVADLAKLTGEARFLLQEGLKIIRQGKRIGLQAMYERLDFDPSGITEDHISFMIAPRLNALGRLGDANPAVELLKTNDLGRARLLVSEIETLNSHRRFLTNSVFQGAEAQIKRDPELVSSPVIILESSEWPSGIIGIVASRIVEQYGKPTILVSTEGGRYARGSARSIDGVNISAALTNIKDILTNYGGHPMAAGFSVPMENLSEFKRRMKREIETIEKKPEVTLNLDGYVPFSDLCLELVRDLDRLAPFGPGNPPLILAAKDVRIKSHSKLGREEEHLKLSVVEGSTGSSYNVIWWHGSETQLPEGLFDLAYRVRVSKYLGQDEVLVEWVDCRQSEEARLKPALQGSFILIDYRQEPHPLVLLRALLSQGQVQIWAEGDSTRKLAVSGIKSYTRDELGSCEALIVWSIPPGPQELSDALDVSAARKVVMFANDPEMDLMENFLKKLAGLIKYTILKNNGLADIRRFGAISGHKESTMWAGVEWLASQGHVIVVRKKGNEVLLTNGEAPAEPDEMKKKMSALRMSLAETKAFRSFYRNVSEEGLRNLCMNRNNP